MEHSLIGMESGKDVAKRMYEFHKEFVHAAGNTVIEMIFCGFEATLLYLMQLYVNCCTADTNLTFLKMHRALLDAITVGELKTADETLCRLLDLCEGVIATKCLNVEGIQMNLEQKVSLVD